MKQTMQVVTCHWREKSLTKKVGHRFAFRNNIGGGKIGFTSNSNLFASINDAKGKFFCLLAIVNRQD